MHNPLFTFDLDDHGTLTITTVCDGCEADAIQSIPIEHLRPLTKVLMAACGEFGFSLDGPAIVAPFGTPEELRAVEACYRRYIEERRAEDDDPSVPAT